MPDRRLSQDELRELIENCSDAIVVSNGDGRVVYWSRGAEDVYGYSKSEALGKITHHILKTQSTIEDLVAKVKANGQWDGELRHTHKDGRQLIVLSRWSTTLKPGAQPDILEINTDITNRNQYERRVEEVNGIMLENQKEINRLRQELAQATRN